jgi:predicted secreted acid phosphatase
MKKKSIVLDIDGTLADTPHVSSDQYHQIDWEAWNEKNVSSPAFSWAVEMAEIYYQAGYEILFITARDDSVRTRNATLAWISSHLPFVEEVKLYMRTRGDFKDDYIVKSEIYMDHIRPHYDVRLFVDDKASNCRAFRAFGIPALCCSEKE